MTDIAKVAFSNNKRLKDAFRLKGKVAIITGGASGIGAAAAHIFSENGAKVVIADIQDDAGQTVAAKLGDNVSYIHCDVSLEDDVIRLIDTTVAKHGKLDIMYNNAGIIDATYSSIKDTTKSDLERLLNVNVVGSFLGAKHAARVMVPERNGCILFTTRACVSIAGIGTPAYTVTKHAIAGLAKSLTAELGTHGIRVNCVSPFAVLTGMDLDGAPTEEDRVRFEMFLGSVGNLKGKTLTAEDISQAALYLASDESGYVSGLNLVVDGGFSVVNPSMMAALPMMKASTSLN